MPDYLTHNRATWDDRAAAHAASRDYRVDELLADPAAISHVVAFDRPRLGDISGLDAVHLQCHIGTDTLSLDRLGARVTGLDFSGASLDQARRIAAEAGAEIAYVEADVYDAVTALGGAMYDLVYTGVGALCWLPSVDRWAGVVAALLRPGGRLFIREMHPMLSTIGSDGLSVEYPYFETVEPMVWTEGGTYVETDHAFTANTTHEWSHGIGEMITALLARGLTITGFAEHDSAPWQALGPLTPPYDEFPGEFRLADRPERLAMTFTLQARAPL